MIRRWKLIRTARHGLFPSPISSTQSPKTLIPLIVRGFASLKNSKKKNESQTPLYMIDPKILTEGLRTFLEEKDSDQAWRSLQKLKRAGVDFPEKELLRDSIALFSNGDALCLLRAHKIMSKLNKENKLDYIDGSLLQSLSLSYAKASMFDLSANAFRLMMQKRHYPDLSFWKPLLELWVQNARGAVYAVKVFSEICGYCSRVMLKRPGEVDILKILPDRDAFLIALRACAALGEAAKAEEVMKHMSKFSITPDNACFCALMKAYEKGGGVTHLKKILVRMKQVQEVPDRSTLNSLLEACINVGEVDVAAQVVLSWSGKSSNDMINDQFSDVNDEMYDVIKEWRGALDNPCGETCTLVLKGFLQCNRTQDAAKFLAKLYCSDNFEYIPCGMDLSGVLKLGLRDETSAVLQEMANQNTPADSMAYSLLVKAYCKVPQPLKAEAGLQDARRVGHVLDIDCYNCVFDAYNVLQDYDCAQRLFREMKRHGVVPIEPIFNKLLSCFEKQGKPYLMFKLLDSAVKDPPLKTELIHWNRTVQAFCKGKLMFDAKAVVKRMKQVGFDADANTYVFLLGGYILMGNKTNEILLLWAEIKERIAATADGSQPLKLTEELLNGFLTIFVKYGFFKNALDVIAKMEESDFYIDKTKYKNMFWHLHKDLYTSKHRSQRRVDMSQERRNQVNAFKAWVGLPTT